MSKNPRMDSSTLRAIVSGNEQTRTQLLPVKKKLRNLPQRNAPAHVRPCRPGAPSGGRARHAGMFSQSRAAFRRWGRGGDGSSPAFPVAERLSDGSRATSAHGKEHPQSVPRRGATPEPVRPRCPLHAFPDRENRSAGFLTPAGRQTVAQTSKSIVSQVSLPANCSRTGRPALRLPASVSAFPISAFAFLLPPRPSSVTSAIFVELRQKQFFQAPSGAASSDCPSRKRAVEFIRKRTLCGLVAYPAWKWASARNRLKYLLRQKPTFRDLANMGRRQPSLLNRIWNC